MRGRRQEAALSGHIHWGLRFNELLVGWVYKNAKPTQSCDVNCRVLNIIILNKEADKSLLIWGFLQPGCLRKLCSLCCFYQNQAVVEAVCHLQSI